jgi:1-deoxy-D-xylulose-5-phosphate synthase
MRYVKPIDEELIARVAAKKPYIVTLEENVIAGGGGSAVGEHGKREDCLADAGLDLDALRVQIDAWWRPMRPQMAYAAH